MDLGVLGQGRSTTGVVGENNFMGMTLHIVLGVMGVLLVVVISILRDIYHVLDALLTLQMRETNRETHPPVSLKKL